MSKFRGVIKKVGRDERGIAMSEYALLLVLVVVALAGITTGLTGAISNAFQKATDAINGAAGTTSTTTT